MARSASVTSLPRAPARSTGDATAGRWVRRPIRVGGCTASSCTAAASITSAPISTSIAARRRVGLCSCDCFGARPRAAAASRAFRRAAGARTSRPASVTSSKTNRRAGHVDLPDLDRELVHADERRAVLGAHGEPIERDAALQGQGRRGRRTAREGDVEIHAQQRRGDVDRQVPRQVRQPARPGRAPRCARRARSCCPGVPRRAACVRRARRAPRRAQAQPGARRTRPCPAEQRRHERDAEREARDARARLDVGRSS